MNVHPSKDRLDQTMCCCPPTNDSFMRISSQYKLVYIRPPSLEAVLPSFFSYHLQQNLKNKMH